jgi:hypothetical protein
MINYQGKYLLIPIKLDIERDAVAKAWEDNGGIVMRVERFWETLELEGSTAALYGNHIFCLVLAQKLNLELVSPPDDFLFYLPEKWLKRAIAKSTITDASRFVYPCFIKPMVPKTFSGKVYNSYVELLEECKQLNDNTPIIQSEIIQIRAEARAFILDNKIASASIYEGYGDIQEAILFVNQFLAENTHQNPSTYVLDVGLLDSGEWAILEANAVWGSGLNGCDANAVACCIAEATKPIIIH